PHKAIGAWMPRILGLAGRSHCNKTGAPSGNDHIGIASTNVDMPGFECDMVPYLLDTELGEFVQAAGQGPGERSRHVLGNNDGPGKGCGKTGEEGFKRRRPASRCADQYQAFSLRGGLGFLWGLVA